VPTELELHTLDTDVFHVTSGAGTFVAAGTGVGMKQTTPTELRGASIEGGTTYELSKGDVMIVPTEFPIGSRRFQQPHSFT